MGARSFDQIIAKAGRAKFPDIQVFRRHYKTDAEFFAAGDRAQAYNRLPQEKRAQMARDGQHAETRRIIAAKPKTEADLRWAAERDAARKAGMTPDQAGLHATKVLAGQAKPTAGGGARNQSAAAKKAWETRRRGGAAAGAGAAREAHAAQGADRHFRDMPGDSGKMAKAFSGIAGVTHTTIMGGKIELTFPSTMNGDAIFGRLTEKARQLGLTSKHVSSAETFINQKHQVWTVSLRGPLR